MGGNNQENVGKQGRYITTQQKIDKLKLCNTGIRNHR